MHNKKLTPNQQKIKAITHVLEKYGCMNINALYNNNFTGMMSKTEYMGYVEETAGLAVITGKGEAKLNVFKATLPAEHLEAWSY